MDVHNNLFASAAGTPIVTTIADSSDAIKTEWLNIDTAIKSKSLSEITVDIGKCYLTSNMTEIVSCLGLGSCVGVIIFDNNNKITGAAHVMLPTHTLAQQGKLDEMAQRRFADIAIPFIYDSVIQMGARPENLRAKIVGGAQMFKGVADEELMDIGKRNVTAVKEQLALKKIPIIAEHIHGSEGRTMRYNVNTNKLFIRTKSGYNQI